MNAVTMLKRPKTLVSNICLTRWGSASMAGASYTGERSGQPRTPRGSSAQITRHNDTEHRGISNLQTPALLYKTSSLPFVRLAISFLRVSMLSGEVTSRVNTSIPAADRLPSVLRDRAVANTLQPCAANSKASELPAPPSEHLIPNVSKRFLQYCLGSRVLESRYCSPCDEDCTFRCRRHGVDEFVQSVRMMLD